MKKIIFSAVLFFIFSFQAFARAPWSTFGSTQAVKVGLGPNPWAMALLSVCPGFPSLACLGNGSFAFSGINFNPPNGKLTFAGIYRLSMDFTRTDDDCGGGSPRFQVNIDMDGDGDSDGNIFIYLGPLPNFSGCAAGWQNSGNLIGAFDARYDLTQLGGAFYDTYANTLALVGSKSVLGIQVVVDSGWNGTATGGDGEQTIWVDNVVVNNHRLTAHGFSK